MFGFCLFWTWVAMETKRFLCLIRLQNTPRTNWLIHFPPSSCSLLVKCTTGTRVVPVTFPWTARRIIKRDRQIIPSTRTRMGRRRQEIKTIITRDKERERGGWAECPLHTQSLTYLGRRHGSGQRQVRAAMWEFDAIFDRPMPAMGSGVLGCGVWHCFKNGGLKNNFLRGISINSNWTWICNAIWWRTRKGRIHGTVDAYAPSHTPWTIAPVVEG